MNNSNKKRFVKYLTDNGISVKNGRIKIADADKIQDLSAKFDLMLAREKGLPEEFAQFASTVIDIELDRMPREGQEISEEEDNLTVTETWKNHDDDTWGAYLTGTVLDVWNFCVNKSHLNLDYFKSEIKFNVWVKQGKRKD